MERRKRILSVICALCILVTGYSNLLSYVTFAGTQTYTLTASDGNTYKITVSYDEASGIPESAVLNVREIIQEETEPQNDPGVIDAEQTANDTEKEPTYKDYVEKSAELLGEETVTFARVFDITLVDSVTGEVYQPNNDVYVRIRMLDDCLSDFSNVGVVHIHGEQDEKVEILDTKYKGETVEFSTDSFSVYVVVAHEGGEIKNPRVEFHFIDKYTDEQYQDPAGIGPDTPSRPYNFINKGGNYQSTQILKDGEILELINDPQNISLTNNEKFFYGWYVVTMLSDDSVFDEDSGKYIGEIKYSWPANPDQIKFEKTISIKTNDVNGDGKITVPDYDNSTDDDTVTWTLNGVTGIAALDRTGTAHVYLAPLYEDFFFINFRKGPRDSAAGLVNNLMTRKLVVFGSSMTSSVRIGNVMCESPDPTHKVFSGWEGDINGDGNIGTDEYFKTVKHILDANGNLDNEEVHSNGNSNGYYITVTKNENIHYIDLYPVFDEARWLYFNTGVKGNGASYIGAAYRLTNDIEESSDNFYYFDKEFFTGSATTTSHLGKRPGYDFEGWYLFANVDAVTGEITNFTTAENVTVKYLDSDSNEHTCTINTTAIKAVDSEGNVLNLGTYYVTPSGEITTTQAEGNIILFKANDGKIRLYKALNEMTVVAKWTPKPVNYTVVYWLQNANDDDYTIASYDKLTAIAGDTIKITSSGNNGRNLAIDAEQGTAYDHAFTLQNTSNTTARYIKELDFIHYKTYDGMSGSTNKGVKVDGDGSTIVNVYYDRNRYTLRFDIGYSTRSNNGSTTDYVEISPADAASYSGTVYGIVNGSLVQLTRAVGSYTYSYSPTYTASTAQESTMYGIVNGQYVQLDSTPVNGYGYTYTQYETAADNEGTQYALVGDEYVELTLVEHPSYNWKPQYTYASTNARSANTTYYGIVSGEYVQLTIGSRSDYYFVINGINTAYYSGLTRYSIATNNNGTQYAIIDGGLVELTRANGQWYYNGAVVNPSTRYTQAGNNTYNNTYVFVEGEMCALIYDRNYYWYAWYYNGNVYSSAQSTNNLASIQTITGGTNYTRANYSGANLADGTTRYKLENGSYVIATDNEGTQYYYDGVGYVPLNRTGNTTYTWQYEDSNGDTVVLSGSDTRYKVGSTSVAYDGARYTRSGSLWNYTYTPTTADAASGQWGVDSRGGHVELTGTTSVIGYTYSANGADYTGTRYKQSNDSTVYTGTRYSDANCTTAATSDEGTQYGKDKNNVVRTLARSPVYKWTYTDANHTTQTYTGTLYQKTTVTGTTTYYVSGITNSENYNQFLTNNRIDCGTTIPEDFIPCGRYNNGNYTIYYYDLTAKYGESIADRWPDTQPDRPGNNLFIGWIAREDSYYWLNIARSSIKGDYEAMNEGVIYVGQTNNYTATTAENGITHEFRCRYQTGVNKYVYRVFFWDPELNGFPTTPDLEKKVNSKGGPRYRAVSSYFGYTINQDTDVKLVTGNENGPETLVPSNSNNDNYSPYNVSSVGYNAMIINYYYRPNQHKITYKYVDQTNEIGSRNYYYNQSLASADIYSAQAEANKPNGYSFAGWYENPDGVGSAFNFNNSTMPDGDIILYAIYKPLRYIIKINPNGGELDHVDHNGYASFGTANVTIDGQPYTYDFTNINSAYDKYPIPGYPTYNSSGLQTYIRSSYGTTLTLTTPERRFVPMTDRVAQEYEANGENVYYYVNFQQRATDGASGIYNDIRSALYLTESEVSDFYNLYRNIVLNSLGNYASSNVGMELLDFGTWKSLYVSKEKYRPLNSNETWVFLGWYKTGANGVEESMPYNDSDPVEGPFTLTAHWRLDGGYSIEYVPKYTMPGGAEINGTMPAWRDPVDDTLSYADGAETEIYKAPTGLTKDGVPVIDDSVIFRGWALVSKTGTDANPVYTPLEVDGDGNITTYYLPSDDYTVNAANAGMDSKLYFQAIYQDRDSSDRRPEIVNLTLDANTGYINTSSSSDLPEWNSSGKSRINDHNFIDGHPTQILFDTVQSSAAVHLYKYATELTEAADGVALTDAHQFFEHTQGYFLLGFDNDAREGDYVAAYPADSVIAVTRTDNRTVYAVWEPMVYLTFVNNTKIKDADDNEIFAGGDVVLNLSSSENKVLEVINKKNGMYEREPLQNYQIKVASGESVTLVFPKGAEEDITISGTNTLGIGKKLIWNTSVDVVENGNTSSYTTDGTSAVSSYTHNAQISEHPKQHNLAKGEANNTKTFSFDETLIENENAVVVTFTAENNKYALLLDDNYSGHYIEYDYGDEDIAPVNGVPKSQKLTIANTRIGYSFMGWAYSKTATEPDFSSDKPSVETAWTIPDLNSTDGFFSEGTTEEDGVIVRRLYAVWEARTDAIYVYKDVPEPGNQDQAFKFTVSITGKYRFGNNASNSDDINTNKEFKLVHGEFLMITTTNDASSVPGSTHSAYIRSVVEVYSPVTNTDGTTSYEKDNSRSDTVEWEKSNVDGKTTNKFENLKISVTEAAVTYYDTSVTVSSESRDGAINVGNNWYTISQLPQKVDTDTFYWDNTDAGGTLVFVNQRQEYDVKIEKTLESNTTSQAIFDYSAEYKDTYTNLAGETVTKTYNLDDFQVTSGSYRTLTEIPAGVKLKITEATDLNDNFKTYVSVDGAAETEGKGTGEFTVGENPADAANSTHIVSYRNVLKSYKVTFKLVDQDGNTKINGMFAISSPVGSLGTDLYANSASSNPGVFYTSNEYWADTYTLSQTVIPDNYIGLTSPVTLVVKGKDPYITSNNEYVTVTGNPTDGFTVLVKNWKTVEVRLNAGLLDPIVNQRTFEFNGTYTLDGKLYDLSRTLLGTGDTPGVIKLTTNSTNDGSEIAANRIVLRIPVHAESLTINEDTSVITVGTQTIGDTYKIEYKYNTGERTAGTSYNNFGNIGVDDSYRTLIFYHERNTKNITVKKTVIADTGNAALDDTYTFNFYIKRGNVAINSYKVYDDDDDAKDLITDTDGKVEFSLKNNETFIVRFPVGADVTVEEALSSTQAEKYAVFMTMPGVELELVNGKADTVTLTGPTENKNIYVYNIPSICKVTDENGVLLYVLQEQDDPITPDKNEAIYIPAIFPTIKGAFLGRKYSSENDQIIGGLGNYYQKTGEGDNVRYEPYEDDNKHQVEMLVDYEVPDNDVVVVGAGYDMVFTTASTSATDGYPFRRTGEYSGSVHENGEVPEGIPTADSIGRAVLTRKVKDGNGNDIVDMDAFFTVNGTTGTNTNLKISDLILDGHGAKLKNTVRGGCLTAFNSEITIEDCVVYRFEADHGGAIFTTGDSLSVNNSIFDTCVSKLGGDGNGGGAINTTANTLSIDNSQFINCSAVFQGGAVYHYGAKFNAQGVLTSMDASGAGKKMIIDGCVFKDCISRAGGGVEADVGRVEVSDCDFIRCISKDITYKEGETDKTEKGTNGGGLNNYTEKMINATTSLEVTGCKFYGCAAIGSGLGQGGGVRATASVSTLTDCKFADDLENADNHCKAKFGGGAAFAMADVEAFVEGCTFENCVATENGGAIYNEVELTVYNNNNIGTNIDSCSAKKGGGIYTKGYLNVEGMTIIENCTAIGGGAICSDGTGACVTIAGGTIRNNNATGKDEGGGAIRVINGLENDATDYNLIISGGLITGNFVDSPNGGKAVGGAISVNQGKIKISDGTIHGNYVETGKNNKGTEALGGAIYVKNGFLAIEDGTISDNYAKVTTNGALGGAIALEGNNAVAMISGGMISGNYALSTKKDAYGGAVVIRGEGASLTMSDGTITGNYVEVNTKTYPNNNTVRYANGGAVAIVDKGIMNLSGGIIKNNTVTHTTAPTQVAGAGIFVGYKNTDTSQTGENAIVPGTLYISGSPDFGGTGVKDAETGELYNTVGNLLKTPLSTGTLNGEALYQYARQDIYLAGYNNTVATSIHVNGTLTGATGTIWVWAEQNPHYVVDQQFAIIDDGVTPGNLLAFRNARENGVSYGSNDSNAPLYGKRSDSNTAHVIWGPIIAGTRKVILRKVQAESGETVTYVPLSGAKFEIHKGGKEGALIKDGNNNTEFESSASGVYFIGVLPYGTYYICETKTPDGYKKPADPEKNWFILTVAADGVTKTLTAE